mgnify:FL=1
MRWNHPPNWPEPPAGWTPPSGWQPPADWPPAPAGWDFWGDAPAEVNDDVWSAPSTVRRPQPAPLLSAPRPPQKEYTARREERAAASGWLWVLALWPLIMGVLGIPVIAAMVASNQAYTAQIVIVILGNTIFGSLDARDVRKAYGESPSVGWAAFLVPVYLWKRRTLTAQNQAPFIVWMVLFVLSLIGFGGTFNNTAVIPVTQPGTGISNPVPDPGGNGGGTRQNKPMRVVWSGKGQGIKQTPSFPISGAWAVKYSYRDTSGYGCYFGIYGPREFDILANETGSRGSDTTFPSPVNGNVSLQINSSCPWKVTVLN